jgi:inner membrane protein
VIPYDRTVENELIDRQTGAKSVVKSQERGRHYVLPESLGVDVLARTEQRFRGIYSALLYDARHEIRGTFELPAAFPLTDQPDGSYKVSEAYVIFGIGDTRGLVGTPTAEWDGTSLEWRAGTDEPAMPRGLRADVGRLVPGRPLSFAMSFDLQGTHTLGYVPVGKQTTIELQSDWPHPSFNGRLLPRARTVTAEGFEATWQVSQLSSNVDSAVRARLAGRHDEVVNTLAVSFIEPVDVYLKTERAAKYGFLFVALTFLVFLLFELLKKLAIHPVQYGLVGMALATFFLLLLALTEHVPFALAYAIASAGCVGLLCFYVSFVLRSVQRAAGFTGMLAALYAALYVLLRSEDMALLLGAVLLFAIRRPPSGSSSSPSLSATEPASATSRRHRPRHCLPRRRPPHRAIPSPKAPGFCTAASPPRAATPTRDGCAGAAGKRRSGATTSTAPRTRTPGSTSLRPSGSPWSASRSRSWVSRSSTASAGRTSIGSSWRGSATSRTSRRTAATCS